MKFTKKLAAVGAAMLVGLAASVATAVPASAHTPEAWATCDAVYVKATNYETKPASGSATIEVANPDFKPATPGTPAQGEPTIKVEKPNPDFKPEVPATYETVVTDREYKKNKVFWVDYQWFPETAKPNANSGWVETGNVKTKQVEKTPYVPAQGTPTIWVDAPNPAYVPAVPGTPEQGTPTKVVDNPDYVAANDAPNNVTITVDGAEVVNMPFGKSFETSWGGFDKYTAHDWSVTITAWNDPNGSKGWTKTIKGTTMPCEKPHVPPTPGALIVTDFTCDAPASIDVTETEGVNYLFSVDGGRPAHLGDMTIPHAAMDNVLGKEYTVIAVDIVTDEVLATWEFEFTKPDCEVPAAPANPTAVITAVCGSADIVLTNPLIKDANQLTASFVVEVDGEFYDAYSVEAGNREEVSVKFDEDSGEHTVEVFQAGTSEWKSIASETVKSDCAVVVPPTEEPEEPTTPTTPTTPEKPVSAEKPAAAQTAKTVSAPSEQVDTLAATGLNPAVQVWGFTIGAVAVALGTLSVVFGLRRRQLIAASQEITED